MEASQLASATLSTAPTFCTATIWPADGILNLGQGAGFVTLADPIVYKVPCATAIPADYTSGSITVTHDRRDDDSTEKLNHSDFRDPFYASTFPMCYALAATTVTAWMLVIMLFVTPRSFLDGGVFYLGRRSGFTHSSSGGVVIGGRPWLQKVAALTVAISLTIATNDTFKFGKIQYLNSAQNAGLLQTKVMDTTRLKTIRLISDTFLWLAQAQTLIRLFPRHREKIIIKWAAFALITLEFVFSALNSFQYTDNGDVGNTMPKSFAEPIPALSYLFELSLGVLYAAWVIYYSLMKKRYAFYHHLMPNMCLVAAISLISIVIPVVFFILDISEPSFTRWGDYVRWVGAAAASVVVWEWVERIEALEREVKKDGILGREVFEGDDVLEVDASESPWLRYRKNRKGSSNGGSSGEGQEATPGTGWPGAAVAANANEGQPQGPESRGGQQPGEQHQRQRTMGDILRPPMWPTRPAPVLTPVSRTDTASAASTVYDIRYQAASESTTRTPDPHVPPQSMVEISRQHSIPQSHHNSEDAASSVGQTPAAINRSSSAVQPAPATSIDLEANRVTPNPTRWQALAQAANPLFHGGRDEAPVEVMRHSTDSELAEPISRERHQAGRWGLRSRMEEFAASQADKVRERLRPTADTASLPVTVIPAPARRGAALQQVLEEEELSQCGSSILESGQRRDSTSPDGRNRGESGGEDGTLSPNNPPLWPGLRPRPCTYDDGSSYSDSLADSSSLAYRELDSDGDSNQSRVSQH